MRRQRLADREQRLSEAGLRLRLTRFGPEQGVDFLPVVRPSGRPCQVGDERLGLARGQVQQGRTDAYLKAAEERKFDPPVRGKFSH